MQKDKPIRPYQSQCHSNAKLYIELKPGGACKGITVDVPPVKAKKNKADQSQSVVKWNIS